MHNCASSLLQTLQSLVQQHPQIKNVFLLTDYPIEDENVPHSITFARVLNDDHREAMHYLLDNLGEQTGLKLTTLMQEIPCKLLFAPVCF